MRYPECQSSYEGGLLLAWPSSQEYLGFLLALTIGLLRSLKGLSSCYLFRLFGMQPYRTP